MRKSVSHFDGEFTKAFPEIKHSFKGGELDIGTEPDLESEAVLTSNTEPQQQTQIQSTPRVRKISLLYLLCF